MWDGRAGGLVIIGNRMGLLLERFSHLVDLLLRTGRAEAS